MIYKDHEIHEIHEKNTKGIFPFSCFSCILWSKKSPFPRSWFTLLEVLAALAILAMAVTATMYLLSASARRMLRAEAFRNESQQLANAVEFYLLHPPETEIGKRFFPYENLTANCTYVDADDLPEEFEVQLNNSKLVKMTVTLRDGDRVVASITIDRIIGL